MLQTYRYAMTTMACHIAAQGMYLLYLAPVCPAGHAITDCGQVVIMQVVVCHMLCTTISGKYCKAVAHCTEMGSWQNRSISAVPFENYAQTQTHDTSICYVGIRQSPKLAPLAEATRLTSHILASSKNCM